MKNHSNQNEDQLNAQQLNELENDAIWALLDKAEKTSTVKASPMFARNVMREIRLSEAKEAKTAEDPQSFWQRIFAPKLNKAVLTLGASAACAALAFTMMSEQPSGNSDVTPVTVDNEFLGEMVKDLSIDELSAIEEATLADPDADTFTDEMLDLANQDPFYISEEEIEIAMQM